ncbi:MAG: FKBP-type peptidyl-prolyl cis-trans isomerase [Bacteroidota bacterium]
MKKYFLGIGVLLMSALSLVAQTKPKTTVKAKAKVPVSVLTKNAADTFAYALGMNIANNLKDQGVTKLNVATLQKAMNDIFASRKTAIDEHQANANIQSVLQGIALKKSAAERAKGVAYLEANKKRPGVITLADGLQYEILKKGDSTSVMPKAEDTIVAHYVGTLTNGKEFDNSVARNEPITIKANEVIPGWTEIVQRMHIGDKWKVYIPSELGYGERGAGQDIPPGATLIFEMELLGVKPFTGMARIPQGEKPMIVDPAPVSPTPGN